MNQFKSAALAYQYIPNYLKTYTSAQAPVTIKQLFEKYSNIATKQQIADVIKKHVKRGEVSKLRAGLECEFWWKSQDEVVKEAETKATEESDLQVAAEYVAEQETKKQEPAKPDMVNQPPHYTNGGIETIDYMRAKMTPEEFRGFLKGNAIKYLSRAELKGHVEDYKKAQWYVNKLVESEAV